MLILSENGYIDIIIYILIMVGGLVLNVYRNYSKKKEMERRAQQQPSHDEQPPFFPEDIFESVLQYDEPEPKVEAEIEKNIEPIDKNLSELDVVVEEAIPVNTYTEGEAAFSETKSSIISAEINNLSEIENQDLTTSKFFETKEEVVVKPTIELDVAKAVVYSEILKPKYF